MARLRDAEVQRNIRVTPRELDHYIERIKRLPDPDSEYNTSHILLALPSGCHPGAGGRNHQARRGHHRRAPRRRISRTLAVANSNSADALEGGALGWRKGPELPTIFQEVVVGLKPGEISKPLLDSYGVHLVKLNEKRSAQRSRRGAGACPAHPDEAQRAAGRCHGANCKLAGIRDRVLKGEDFRRVRLEHVGRQGLGGERRRSGLERSRRLRARVRSGDREAGRQRDQRALPDGIRLAHRAGAGPPQVRHHRGDRSAIAPQASWWKAGPTDETELWLRRLRDEAYIETSM